MNALLSQRDIVILVSSVLAGNGAPDTAADFKQIGDVSLMVGEEKEESSSDNDSAALVKEILFIIQILNIYPIK